MKKIKKMFSTLQSIQSIEIPVSEFLDFKIIDAKLELITESNNANVVIKYEGYDANDNPVSWIVDELPSFSTKTKLSFNISDELQESINNAQPLKLNFFDKETNLPTQINTNGQIALDAEFVTISEYNKNSENFSVNLGKSGSLDTNLTTGCFSLTTPLTSIDNKTLPVLLNLNYNSFDVKKELKNGLPKNFSLNYGQLLFKGDDTSDLTFEYLDNNGEKQLIEEKYYVGDEKIDRSELMIDLDGNYITKDGKRVSTKLESTEGVNLVSSIEGINGYKSVSYQPEELENVLNQIKNLEMNKSQLNSAISENKENLCLYAITKKIMRDQIDTQEQSLTESKNELSLQENIEKLKSIYYTESRDYSGSDLAKKYLKGHFFTKYHIENLLKTLNGRNSENKELNAFDKIAVGDENNKQYLKWDDVFCVLKLLNIESSSIYSLGYDLNNTDGSIKSQQKNIEKSLSYYNQQIDSSFIDNSAVESNIEIDGETKNKIVNENLVYNVSEKDLLNIDLQIKNLTAKNNEYILQIEEIDILLDKYNHQKELLELQVPVHYLYDSENVIYGFGKTQDPNVFRLILIADVYENSIFISYESDSNKISSIIDSNENKINFEYENNLLKTITDFQNKKINFKYDENNNLLSLFCDKHKTLFYFSSVEKFRNNTNKLIGILNSSGFGSKISYSHDKVSKIQKLSALKFVKNGKIEYLQNLDQINLENLSDFLISNEYVEIIYNNFKSTTLKDGNNKLITYLFDNNGNLKTQYDSKFNEYTEPIIYPKISMFSNTSNKITQSVKKLPYGENYLSDVMFSSNQKIQIPSLYLGDNLFCSSNTIPYSYQLAQNFHEKPSGTENKISVSSSNLSLLNEKIKSSPCGHNHFVVSGWAKADSLFVLNSEAENEYPNYLKNRTFNLKAEIKYTDGTINEYTSNFDWRNTDWQYNALGFELDKDKTIQDITFHVCYDNNYSSIKFTELELKEGISETQTFDNLDRLIKIEIGHNNWVKKYEYEGTSTNPVKEIVIDKKGEKPSFETKFEYSLDGKLTKSISSNGLVKENIYNKNGILTKSVTYNVSDPTSKFYDEKAIDEKGNVTHNLNALGEKISTLSYLDGTSIVTEETGLDGTKTAFAYDNNGNLTEQTISLDNIENTTTSIYCQDFLTTLKHNGVSINYDYDNLGRIENLNIENSPYLSKIYGDGEETTIYSNGSAFRKVFDKNKNVTDVYSLEGYNTTNQVETQIVQNVYDIYGNLISSKDFSNGENIQKIYTDNFGNTYKTEIGMHDSTFKIQNSFDDNHENITQTEIEIDETEIDNTNNKIDKINYNYTYSNTPDPKLESITLQTSSNDTVLSNITQNLFYDGLDRLTNIAVNGLSKEFSYLKSGDHTTNLVSNLTFGINGIKKDNLRYFYDEKGNITQIRENNSLVLRYKYDSLSRLVREDNKILNKTFVFSYDAGGNILNKLIYDFSLVDNLDHLTLISENTYSYPVSGWRDQLKEFNGKKIIYDSLGNPESYLGKTLVWSHARQLDKFDDIEFQYNASGLRTSKKNNGVTTKFYLNGNKILRQKDGMNDMYFYYGADGIIGFHLKNNFINDDFYFKKNAQNDIIGIYDSNKTLICKYDYDAFGVVFCRYLSNNGEYVPIEADYAYNDTSNSNRFVAFKNPFRYRSYYYDFETKLYYLNSRYYDPEIGRFINSDDVSILDDSKEFINGLNLYCYCNNNPVNYGDYTGKSLIALFLILLGTTILGGVVGGMTAYNNGARGWDLFKGIILGASFGLAVGGFIIAGASVFMGAILGKAAYILGVPVLQAFSIGALAFDFTAFFIAPIFGIQMSGIEFEDNNNYDYRENNPYDISRSLSKTIIPKSNKKFFQKGTLNNVRISRRIIKQLQKLYN